MSEKIFILGSNSFAGVHFVDYALSKGCEVIGISRSPEPHPAFLAYAANPNRKHFRFFQADINHDFAKLTTLLKEFRPSYVIDYAGQGMVAPSWKSPDEWFTTNIVAKVRLHEVLRQCDFLQRYVRCSTPEVYGSTDKPVTEDMALNPSTPYAVSHAAIDMSLKTYFKQYGFPTLITRSSNFYGQHQQLYRILPKTILCIKAGKPLTLDGGGHSTRNFIHISDVCSAIWKLMFEAPAGEIYHVASDDYVSIRDLVGSICKKMGANFDEVVRIGTERPGKDSAYLLNCQKLTSLGWSPKTSLDSGISQTINWVEENWSTLKDAPWDYIHKP